MSDDIERLEDGTVIFIPERLNRDPVVLRGLSSDEMWVALGVGGSVGLLLGIPLAFLTASVAMAPTLMIVMMAVALLGGGSLLRRAKRGRPETWLYRQLEWILAAKWKLTGSPLVVHAGPWTVRRTRRHRPTPRS